MTMCLVRAHEGVGKIAQVRTNTGHRVEVGLGVETLADVEEVGAEKERESAIEVTAKKMVADTETGALTEKEVVVGKGATVAVVIDRSAVEAERVLTKTIAAPDTGARVMIGVPVVLLTIRFPKF